MKRKMSDMINDAYMDQLLGLEPVEVDENAIKRRTFEKLELTGKEVASGNATPFVRKMNGGKPRWKALRVTAIAVALMMALSTAVYAATVIYSMVQQKVGFFEPNGTNQTPVSGPTYHGALAMDIERYNASVGQSVTDNGKTVTLDTIAVDDNFINAFFTVAFDEPINLDNIPDIEAHFPAYYKLRYVLPHFDVKVNGKEIDGGFSTSDDYDPYMVNDSTVKMMIRYAVPTILPNTFDISLHGEEWGTTVGSSAQVGTFDFALTVDKTASAAVTRTAEPGVYTLDTEDGQRSLDLNKLAVTPFGAIFSVKGHWNGEINPDPAYLMPEDFYITDDKGNVLNTFWNNMVSSNAPYYALEMMGIANDAENITLTPILDSTVFDDGEDRTYSVTDIGAKIEINNLGGYYLEDYIVEAGRISLVLRPYGRCNYFTGGVVVDTDNVTLAGGRSGLINEQIDRKTGLLTYSIDLYAATPEDLQAISTFTVWYGGAFELDEAAAIKLPLSPIRQ